MTLPVSLKKAERTGEEIKEAIALLSISTDDVDVKSGLKEMKWLPSDVVASFLEDDVVEAVAFFKHLKAHPEVKTALVHAGMPVCKICGKSSKENVFGGERK